MVCTVPDIHTAGGGGGVSASHKRGRAHRMRRAYPVAITRFVEVPVDPVQQIQGAVGPARTDVSQRCTSNDCAAAAAAPKEEDVMPRQVIHIPRVLQHHLRQQTSEAKACTNSYAHGPAAARLPPPPGKWRTSTAPAPREDRASTRRPPGRRKRRPHLHHRQLVVDKQGQERRGSDEIHYLERVFLLAVRLADHAVPPHVPND